MGDGKWYSIWTCPPIRCYFYLNNSIPIYQTDYSVPVNLKASRPLGGMREYLSRKRQFIFQKKTNDTEKRFMYGGPTKHLTCLLPTVLEISQITWAIIASKFIDHISSWCRSWSNVLNSVEVPARDHRYRIFTLNWLEILANDDPWQWIRKRQCFFWYKVLRESLKYDTDYEECVSFAFLAIHEYIRFSDSYVESAVATLQFSCQQSRCSFLSNSHPFPQFSDFNHH